MTIEVEDFKHLSEKLPYESFKKCFYGLDGAFDGIKEYSIEKSNRTKIVEHFQGLNKNKQKAILEKVIDDYIETFSKK